MGSGVVVRVRVYSYVFFIFFFLMYSSYEHKIVLKNIFMKESSVYIIIYYMT